AAHFHFAGLVLPVLTGLAGRVRPGRMSTLAAVGVVVGVPLVAVGITLERFGVKVVEWLASWWLTAACVLVAWLQLRLARRSGSRPARLLFALSGVGLLAGMALAAVYGVRAYGDVAWLTVPVMLVLHAAANAFGFCLPGLLAWKVGGAAPASAPADGSRQF